MRLTVWMCLLSLVIACRPVLGPTVYMAAPALAEAEQWQSGTIAYCDEWVSLREAPSKESRRLVKIPLGEEVQVIVSSGEFFLCKYGNLTGYVMSRYVRLSPSSGNQVQAAETATVPARMMPCISCPMSGVSDSGARAATSGSSFGRKAQSSGMV